MLHAELWFVPHPRAPTKPSQLPHLCLWASGENDAFFRKSELDFDLTSLEEEEEREDGEGEGEGEREKKEKNF